MKLTTEFCNDVISEYSKRFSPDEIQNGYKGLEIKTAQVVMDIIRICFDKLDDLNEQNPN